MSTKLIYNFLLAITIGTIILLGGCNETNIANETKNYACDGTGTITYAKGSVYTGQCKENQAEGDGIIYYYWGEKYDGEWHNGKKEGKGIYFTQYGTYEGIWENGKLINVLNQNSQQEAYSYFNNIRKQTGMIELEPNGILENAAQSHSNYIEFYDEEIEGLDYHHEKEGKEGFTGIKASDRAIYQGYFSKSISEGISHKTTAEMSINSLMTAIYHRFTILKFTTNEIGIGFTQENKSMVRNLVHNPGNSILNDLCQSNNYSSGKYYYKVCSDESHKIGFDLFQNAKKNIEKQNPSYVLWPANNSVDNLYEFNGETPNPMPDYEQTGNPISIQFNKYYYPNKITMQSFKLFKANKKITNTKILTKQTDPNKKFSEYQYALFPLDILDKDSTYKVIFTYKYNEEEKSITWSFSTMKKF